MQLKSFPAYRLKIIRVELSIFWQYLYRDSHMEQLVRGVARVKLWHPSLLFEKVGYRMVLQTLVITDKGSISR